jgi:hypothetical protein
VDALGRIAVTFRQSAREDWTTSASFLAQLAADGSFLLAPRRLVAGVADDPVIALLGDDAVFAAWAALDPVSADWSVWGGVFAIPGGEPLVPAFALGDPSPATKLRPHAAAMPLADGGYRVGVCWEQASDGEERVVLGRLLTVWP